MLPIACRVSFILVLTALVSLRTLAGPPPSGEEQEKLFQAMQWREIGPANFSGRIVDVEALESDFTRVFVASASGGVWRSNNAGTTWESLFDDYPSASIGDIAVFQRNPDILWVGTGEANNRNSVAWGDGIYKSTDGGATFRRMGLENTRQIARVVTHPRDPDIVYVAAIGSLWGPSGDRGLFKTEDGGRTWKKLTRGLPDDGRTGATDLIMDPSDPDTLYVAFYERLRKPWRFKSGGPNGGIFKSGDGGKSWKKLTKGLPQGDTGRIGLTLYRSNPKIVMAIVEHGFQPAETHPDYADMTKLGSGVYRSEDGGKSWSYLNRYNNRPFYYSKIHINPLDDQRVYVLTTTIQLSDDGGRTFRPGGLSFEGGLDFHAMWFDPRNKDRYYLGKDKGLTLTHDHGASFQFFDNLPVAQFYAIGVDMRDPYYVYGGTQDNGTWGGPSFSKDVRGTLADSWWKLHWGDGMYVQIDPHDWRKVYTEAENGSFRRYDAETRRVEFARPTPRNIVNYRDYVPQSEVSSANAPGGRSPNRLPPDRFRFNWRAPLVMSPHNSQTLYLAGNHIFRTVDGGRKWRIISPDLSTNDPSKTRISDPGGLTRDASGAETHCSVTAFSESPLMPGLIWVGSDDGRLHVTRNGGVEWIDVRAGVPGVPPGIWVSSIEASTADPAEAFVTFDGHRSDDYRPWIFRTGDYGRSWSPIVSGIPEGHSMYVVRQDPRNPELLFAGSEFALFASLNRGQSWRRFMNGLPTVAIHDLVIHPRDGDLIAGTHGRGIWILDDITPLQQLNSEVLEASAHLFESRPATIWEDATRGGVRGHFFFAAENPPSIPKRENIVRSKLISGALVSYYLGRDARTEVLLEISDLKGEKRRVLAGAKKAGIHRLLWDLNWAPGQESKMRFVAGLREMAATALQMKGLSDEQRESVSRVQSALSPSASVEDLNALRQELAEHFGHIRRFRRIIGRSLQGPRAEPGEYSLQLTVDGEVRKGTLTVRPDPMR